MSSRDISRVLAGEQSYDALPVREQALVRATWDERITAARTGLEFTSELAASGVDWAEADAAGNVIVHASCTPAAKKRPSRAAGALRHVR